LKGELETADAERWFGEVVEKADFAQWL